MYVINGGGTGGAGGCGCGGRRRATLGDDVINLPSNSDLFPPNIDLGTGSAPIFGPTPNPVYGGPSQITQGGQTYNVTTNPKTGLLQLQLPMLSQTAFKVGSTSITVGALAAGGGAFGLLLLVSSRKKRK